MEVPDGFQLQVQSRQASLERIAQDAVKEVATTAQPQFDRLHREHAGKPVEEVEPHVRALFRRLDWKPDRPSEICDYADAIRAATALSSNREEYGCSAPSRRGPSRRVAGTLPIVGTSAGIVCQKASFGCTIIDDGGTATDHDIEVPGNLTNRGEALASASVREAQRLC